jgi:hypothetical protein
MYFAFMYESKRMKPVEIVLGRVSKEEEGE